MYRTRNTFSGYAKNQVSEAAKAAAKAARATAQAAFDAKRTELLAQTPKFQVGDLVSSSVIKNVVVQKVYVDPGLVGFSNPEWRLVAGGCDTPLWQWQKA